MRRQWELERFQTATIDRQCHSRSLVMVPFDRIHTASLKIEIHEIHKINEIHLSKHRNPQRLGLYEIHWLIHGPPA